MKRNILLKVAFSSLLTVAALASAGDAHKVVSETLMQATSSWDGTPYYVYPTGTPQLSILKITIPAHKTLPWHTHPMPNAAYVLSGHLTVESKKDGQKKIIRAGETLAETMNIVHRGYTDNEPATLIVFYAGDSSEKLSELAEP